MVKPRATCLAGSLAAALTASSGAAAGGETGSALLICRDAPSEPLCTALAAALRSHLGTSDVVVLTTREAVPEDNSAPVITFATTFRRRDGLAGHLTWSGPDGRSGAGPVLEISAMDTPLTDMMLADFARQLVSVSGLPDSF